LVEIGNLLAATCEELDEEEQKIPG